MNNNCPTCGALYNVATKDIGRRLKCKKCSSSLRVTEKGLEIEEGTDTVPASEAKLESKTSPAMVEDDADDESAGKKKKRERERAERGPRANPLAMLNRVGGAPTLLFGFGVFLVIVYIAMPIIGQARTARANANKDMLKNEMDQEKFELRPKKKQADWTDAEKKKIDEETPKIEEKYARLIEEAGIDAESTRVSNIRSTWTEMYGLMFGFILVAFGCIGYLRTEQPLVMKIVAGVILTFMMMIMFMKFGGCGFPK